MPPTLHLHTSCGALQPQSRPDQGGLAGEMGGAGAKLSRRPQVRRQEGSLAQTAAQVAPPPPADTLQTHSGLFLEELEMLVPSTPTSASGAFWKGSELGTDPPAQPAAPSTTSKVVKSKSTSHPAWGGAGKRHSADSLLSREPDVGARSQDREIMT